MVKHRNKHDANSTSACGMVGWIQHVRNENTTTPDIRVSPVVRIDLENYTLRTNLIGPDQNRISFLEVTTGYAGLCNSAAAFCLTNMEQSWYLAAQFSSVACFQQPYLHWLTMATKWFLFCECFKGLLRHGARCDIWLPSVWFNRSKIRMGMDILLHCYLCNHMVHILADIDLRFTQQASSDIRGRKIVPKRLPEKQSCPRQGAAFTDRMIKRGKDETKVRKLAIWAGSIIPGIILSLILLSSCHFWANVAILSGFIILTAISSSGGQAALMNMSPNFTDAKLQQWNSGKKDGGHQTELESLN
ncbi:hypothetical protein V9T40_010797 [Parthenolecanium corni]|uniref:Uncharacterized protein n=1 Tax=Parthenolecanium corni TaxID=536013 RepID=A0AAN9T5U4_9HEMI